MFFRLSPKNRQTFSKSGSFAGFCEPLKLSALFRDRIRDGCGLLPIGFQPGGIALWRDGGRAKPVDGFQVGSSRLRTIRAPLSSSRLRIAWLEIGSSYRHWYSAQVCPFWLRVCGRAVRSLAAYRLMGGCDVPTQSRCSPQPGFMAGKSPVSQESPMRLEALLPLASKRHRPSAKD